MTEIERIRDQIQKAFEGGAWHGPAVRETLEGVQASRASRRPIGAAHTIWEIVLHMATWQSVVARRLGGDPVAEVPPEVDWPAVGATDEESWRAAVALLRTTHAELLEATRGVGEDSLDQPAVAGTSTRYVLLHGAIQHDVYHAGQIALLRRA